MAESIRLGVRLLEGLEMSSTWHSRLCSTEDEMTSNGVEWSEANMK